MMRLLCAGKSLLALILFTALSVLSTAVHAAERPADTTHQSGYGDDETVGGPDGVNLQLQQMDEERESLLDLDALEEASNRWSDWKRRLNEEYNLKMGLIALTLYQRASDKPDAGDETRDAVIGATHPGVENPYVPSEVIRDPSDHPISGFSTTAFGSIADLPVARIRPPSSVGSRWL